MRVTNCWCAHIFVLENSGPLFVAGAKSIDFVPDIENKCPENYTRHTLYPDRSCKDKYYLTDNSTLVLYDTKKYEEYVFPVNQFCIYLNGKAKTKHDHFAQICLNTKERDFRMS